MNTHLRKILAITTCRSDYYLVRRLFQLLHADPSVDLKLLVSGAHLSPSYGYSVKQIEDDGFACLAKLETLIDSDSKASRLKTASLLLQNSIDLVASYNPDVIVMTGDREDVIVGALLGSYLEIPTLHLYGGDHVQDGHVDNPIRHATSKLATVHVTALEQHKERLLKMGEPAFRIFHTGSVALDKFILHKPVPISEIKKQLSIKVDFNKHALLIFHPVAEEREYLADIFESILSLLKQEGIFTFVGIPNTDPGNKRIIEVFQKYKEEASFYFYKAIEGDLFLSIFKQSDFIIGNSSAGITEAASIPIPTINVGLRQTGRFAGKNVLWSSTKREDIQSAIHKARSAEFLNSLKGFKNPYGDGDSSEKVYKILKEVDFKSMFYKKEDALNDKTK